VLISPKGALSPGSGCCIGVIDALESFVPPDTIYDKIHSPSTARQCNETTRNRLPWGSGLSGCQNLSKNRQLTSMVYSNSQITPYTELGLSIRLSILELHQTGDWNFSLGPSRRVRANTGGADQWMLLNWRTLSRSAIVYRITSTSLEYLPSVFNEHPTLEMFWLRKNMFQFSAPPIMSSSVWTNTTWCAWENKNHTCMHIEIFVPLRNMTIEACTAW